MKLVRLATFAFLANAAFGFQAAYALSEDQKTMTTASGAPRFSDPDDKTPSAIYLGGGSQSAGGVDQTSVRYDYDPSSGSYIPHSNH